MHIGQTGILWSAAPLQSLFLFLLEKTFENVCNLESVYMVSGNDAITVSEKLIGVIAPLTMSKNNADLHRAEEKQISQAAYSKF